MNSKEQGFETYLKCISNLNRIENIADEVENRLDYLLQENQERNFFKRDLRDLNGRNDTAILFNVQRDIETESYITQLEKTLEIVSFLK